MMTVYSCFTNCRDYVAYSAILACCINYCVKNVEGAVTSNSRGTLTDAQAGVSGGAHMSAAARTQPLGLTDLQQTYREYRFVSVWLCRTHKTSVEGLG